MQKHLSVLDSIFLFFLGVVLFFLLGLFVIYGVELGMGIPYLWWVKVLVTAVMVFGVVFYLLRGGKTTKIFFSLSAVLVGFILFFIFVETAHSHAMWDICYPAIGKKHNQDPMGKDGLLRSWYQHSECESNVMPFPWGRQAIFSENPPGFELKIDP